MTQTKDRIGEVKGMCMSCGHIMKGNTRPMVEGQFSWHNEERHKRKLNAMEAIVLTFFTDELPKIEVRKKREAKKKVWSSWDTKGEKKTPMNAEWI